MIKHWQHTELVSPEEFEQFKKLNIPVTPTTPLPNNVAVYVQGGSERLEGIFDPTIKGIRKLRKSSAPNRELRLYEDALHSEHITVLAVDGFIGTGKTSTLIEHLAKTNFADIKIPVNITGGVEYELDPTARRILIAKPAINADGEEYGFLPGDLREKLEPTLMNYTQYFNRFTQQGYELLATAGYVEILALGFIRGLDAENIDVVVDECQNTRELVTAVSRRAKGSRIFLMGDTSPFQIDRPGNTPTNNGLYKIIDLLKGAKYFQYIEMKSLENIVRSEEVRDLVRRLFKQHGEDPTNWKV
jgi:predicted ribonuclease YlaK